MFGPKQNHNFYLYAKTICLSTMARLIILAIYNFILTSILVGKINWSAVPLQAIETLFGSLSKKFCLWFLPCDLFFIYFWTILTLLTSIATILKIQATLAPNSTQAGSVIQTVLAKFTQTSIWATFYTLTYFAIINISAPYFAIVFILLALPTFYIPAIIANERESIAKTVVKSILMLEANFLKTLAFLFFVGITIFAITTITIESGLLNEFDAEVAGIIIWFEILLTYALKDIFMAKIYLKRQTSMQKNSAM